MHYPPQAPKDAMIVCGLPLMRHASLASVVALTLVLLPVSAQSQPPGDLPGTIIGRIRAVPMAQRIDYTVNAAVRPFPLVWIGRDNIGEGHFTTRRSATGTIAYEFIGGSDPARAPRKTNRWGYLAEEVRTDGGSMVALIKQSNEQSLGEATAAAGSAATQRRFPFRVYAGTLAPGAARVGDTTFTASQDFTVGGFEGLLGQVGGTPVALKQSTPALGTRTGVLSTLIELLTDSVNAWRTKVPDPVKGRRVPYFFNNITYQLHVASTEFRRTVTIGGQRHNDVLHAKLEGSQPGTDKRMSFEVWYPVAGPHAAQPLRVLVQPRWWFRFELVMANVASPSK